jgi:NAD(P)-dependent dehydrogenase (short-subunit alcohol dehydrogenase family)
MTHKSLTGKTALITGAGSGIGLATARLFAAEGARVIMAGRSMTTLEKAAASIDGQTMALPCDVTNLASLDQLARELEARQERLDILFANAGVLHIGPLPEIDEAAYNKVFDTSVKGTIFTVQKLLPLLNERASVILNGAAIAHQGIRGLLLNAAAKSAVRSLARTLAVELRSQDIRVNTVSPGSIETPILAHTGMPIATALAVTENRGAFIPLGRQGTADELAQAVLFLASDASSYITGIDLAVDGGQGQV